MISLEVSVDDLLMKRPFVITGHVFDVMPTVVVTLTDGSCAGRGEAAGVYYLHDDAANMVEMIETVRHEIEGGADRAALQKLLPPCGARNALDCALWDLEAARSGEPAWRLAGLGAMRPLLTTMTAGADAPEVMARDARGFAGAKAVKLKLTGDPDLDAARVTAVRSARPDVWLAVDANQGYDLDGLKTVMPALVRNDVKLVEQPLPRGAEAALDGLEWPIPLAADESVLSCADLTSLVGRFQVANIKLDKCGGLTEALAMVEGARALGLSVMVGNMAGSSWAMAPAFIVGQFCEIVDLDGPISLRNDRRPSVTYEDGEVWCDDSVWGRGVAHAGAEGPTPLRQVTS